MLHLLTSIPLLVWSSLSLFFFFFFFSFFKKLRNECFVTQQVRGDQFFAAGKSQNHWLCWAKFPPSLQHNFCPLLLRGQ